MNFFDKTIQFADSQRTNAPRDTRSPEPTGRWSIVTRSDAQLITDFSGDVKGGFPQFGLNVNRDKGVFVFGFDWEFSVFCVLEDVAKLAALLTKAGAWLKSDGEPKLALLDFYSGAGKSHGGSIAMASSGSGPYISAIFWSRGDELELGFQMSQPVLAALAEMTAFASEWVKDTSLAP